MLCQMQEPFIPIYDFDALENELDPFFTPEEEAALSDALKLPVRDTNAEFFKKLLEDVKAAPIRKIHIPFSKSLSAHDGYNEHMRKYRKGE